MMNDLQPAGSRRRPAGGRDRRPGTSRPATRSRSISRWSPSRRPRPSSTCPRPTPDASRSCTRKAGEIVQTGKPLVDFEVAGDAKAAPRRRSRRPQRTARGAAPRDQGTVVGHMPTSDEELVETAIVGRARRAGDASASGPRPPCARSRRSSASISRACTRDGPSRARHASTTCCRAAEAPGSRARCAAPTPSTRAPRRRADRRLRLRRCAARAARWRRA